MNADQATLRILVADDNQDAALSLAMLLEFEGYKVDTVHDGLEAVERAARFLPDVVILDIGMPGLNGYDAARQIRMRCTHALRLIALTGSGQENDRQLSAEAGFDAHLIKPADFSKLAELISQWSPPSRP